MLVALSNIQNNSVNRTQTEIQQRYIPRYGATDSVSFSGGKIGLKQIGLGKFSKYAKFENYAPEVRNFLEYKIPVHNSELNSYMNNHYSSKTFNNLFDFADKKGVFDFQVDHKTGFVKTSVIGSGEDVTMADTIWVTDTCRNMSLLKKKHPELYTKALNNLSKFYVKQQPEFEKIIEKPELFKNNLNWFTRIGGAHAFDPKTLEANQIFIKSRLESIGLFLQTASDLIVDGLVKGANYGYKDAHHVGGDSKDAIANCVKYLKAIDYPNAPSCGAWEEKTFKHSLTSDTSIINEGLRKVFKLMYAKTNNKELLQLRAEIFNSKHGDVFADKKELSDLIKKGEKRVIKNHNEEAPEERELDAALCFVTHSGKLSNKGVIEDVFENMKVLEKIEILVGDNGIARYQKDKYKNHDYDLRPKGFALKLTKILAPKNLEKQNHEAQWFMVSDIAKGYGTQIKKITDSITKENRFVSGAEESILRKLLAKETEYINRSYARISGENSFKANGKPCSAYKVPEAIQAVTDNKRGGVKYVIGTNTPLAWAQASLLDASSLYAENLATLEKLGINI